MNNYIEACNFEELYEINKSHYNIGIMKIVNSLDENVKTLLVENFEELNTTFKCEIAKKNFEEDLKQLNDLYPYLEDKLKRDDLIEFVKYLVSNFADVTDAPLLGLTIEKVKDDMCRFFHCDMNSLRLVYTIIGPSTLWVEDSNVNREFLGQGRNDLVIKNKELIKQVPNNSIVLLKGNGFYNGQNRGVVHASPKISGSGEKRILLRVEALYHE